MSCDCDITCLFIVTKRKRKRKRKSKEKKSRKIDKKKKNVSVKAFHNNYALTTILSIVNEENKVYPVAFYSHTFTVAKLNYDIHNKKLLAIFEAFKIWWHYLEGLAYPINISIDHKNLEYFSTTKILTQKQA